ncbi:MAG TPA: aspartate aminotransferase family protein [Actinomycetota bacterium]|jgi:glutamate/tyrosine decarboxylase-like PLP-dependent enzyme|nr:aspartate aminotransferase family protein [Actinomycetota bacterium]
MDEMAGSLPRLGEMREVLGLVAEEALRFVETLPEQSVRSKGADDAAMRFGGPLPEEGDGATAAIRKLLDDGMEAVIRSAGPRFFHFVIGGSTPASLAADWLASAIDQNNGAWVAAPLAARLEVVAISWLKELFGLPQPWGGVLTTGATMANFVGLACARRWWAERHGVDIDDRGFAGLPEVPVLSSGYIHPSATKALAMLGMGRSKARTFSADDSGRLDLEALERALRGLRGEPAILIANAGEVNAGDFDPIAAMADLSEQHGAWLHVDGAFGLFAAVTGRTAHLVEGIDRAHSVIADGHKWLNVPYDCGFAFVRDPALMVPVFSFAAAYLPKMDDPRPNFMIFGPEASRRARSLPVWATLHAYGRRGVREIVEQHLDLAQRVARRVDEAPDLERLADVPLNIVCFRYRPEGASERDLDDLNRRLGEAVLEDGRVYVGTTVYRGRVAFRPAFVNWLTAQDDVDLLVDVIRELGARLATG